MSCPHSLDQREASVYTEGLCPLCLCAENKALIEQTKSDAKVIAELNIAIADRNLEIEGDMKVIAALMQALETIAEPILHAEQRAKASGERLSGLAYQIYTSSENLRAMARDALKKLNEQNVGK